MTDNWKIICPYECNLFFSPISLQRKASEVRAQKGQLKRIEDLGAAMEERLILDNR